MWMAHLESHTHTHTHTHTHSLFPTRGHCFSLFLLLGFVSDPHKHLKNAGSQINELLTSFVSLFAGCRGCACNRHQTTGRSHLVPGVQDHDIIGGEVVLGQLPGHLLDLCGRRTEGWRGYSSVYGDWVFYLFIMLFILRGGWCSIRWQRAMMGTQWLCSL